MIKKQGFLSFKSSYELPTKLPLFLEKILPYSDIPLLPMFGLSLPNSVKKYFLTLTMLFIRKISAIIFTITSPCLGYALLGRHTFKLMGAASITCKKEISYLISFLAHQYILGISRFPLWKKVIIF